MPEAPSASVVIPTLDRPDYLSVALASVVPQASRVGAEVIVVSDGPNERTAAVAQHYGARLVSLPEERGLNAARNVGIHAAQSELIVFVDDDVDAPEGWLEALLAGARAMPDTEVFGGPIRPRLEGAPPCCGRACVPISALDFGPEDQDIEQVWGANMAIRRNAFDRVGLFDETIHGRGDEEEWEVRYSRSGGRIRYVADAGLDHRRTRSDARLRVLIRDAYRQGRESKRQELGLTSTKTEVRILAGCAWHTVRRRCAYGIVMGARATGSLHRALHRRGEADGQDDFLSGDSGHVVGIRATSRALVADAYSDAANLVRAQPLHMRRAARAWPRRRVLALAVERVGEPNLLASARDELLQSKHVVRFDSTAVGGRGKFENLNSLLAENPAQGYDWLLVLDDDVALPRGFLDAFVFLSERFGLRVAQPAHRARSHAAWQITRRRPWSLVRETPYVEIGPVVAFQAATFDVLLPFPPLRTGWGLDAHWAAVARDHGWRLGIVDATPIRHGLRRTAGAYDPEEAIAEGRRFLADKPYVKAADAQRTLITHRTWH